MYKTPVTPELANMLKTLRLQKKITAKALSLHINRSPAYITKLEKCETKSIDNELLDSILSFLTDGDAESDTLVEKIYAISKQYPSSKEVEEQLWFVNFDTVLRRIPIPEKLISHICERIQNNNISKSTLLMRINANESLTAEENADDNIECNRWFATRENTTQSIKIVLSEEEMNAILDRKVTFSSYVFVFCIAFYVLKIEQFGERVAITLQENIDLMRKTTALLNEYKFYSLAEKSKALANAENQEQINGIWNAFDTENQKILAEILSGLRIASELDIEATNSRLKKFCENMQWDIWFVLKLISLDYSSLQELSITRRKEFLNEIDQLILKYKELPSAQKTMETY